jgi:hypothetical protein
MKASLSAPLNPQQMIWESLAQTDSQAPQSREAWSKACQFHPLSQAQVLHEVKSKVSLAGRPIVLLDLDSTLYQVEPRSYQILKHWARSSESRAYPEVQGAFRHFQESHVGYSVQDTFQQLGIELSHPEGADSYRSSKQFWSDRFFHNEWLKWDRPYPGAVHYVQVLHELGAQLVYLTGRDEERMREGTIANLTRDGFPWGHPSVQLWMKPSRLISDLVFKKTAAERLRSLGVLIASFENEPHNVAGLQSLYPDAMHVWMDTLCSDHPAPICQGLYRIQSFDLF